MSNMSADVRYAVPSAIRRGGAASLWAWAAPCTALISLLCARVPPPPQPTSRCSLRRDCPPCGAAGVGRRRRGRGLCRGRPPAAAPSFVRLPRRRRPRARERHGTCFRHPPPPTRPCTLCRTCATHECSLARAHCSPSASITTVPPAAARGSRAAPAASSSARSDASRVLSSVDSLLYHGAPPRQNERGAGGAPFPLPASLCLPPPVPPAVAVTRMCHQLGLRPPRFSLQPSSCPLAP